MTYHRPKIILLGDSLTQTSFEGWGGHLANVYQRRADIINRGYSGYNTRFYLHLLEKNKDEDFLPICEQSLVFIFFGANDAALLEQDPHHYVSVEDYQSNLKSLVQVVKSRYPQEHGKHCILLITPPPVHHEQRLLFQKQKFGEKATGKLERTLENTGRYAAACQAVGAELSIPCLDLYHDMLNSKEDWGQYFCDGLHFSAAGHEVVGQAVLKCIKDNFSTWHVAPDSWTGQWANSGSVCEGLSHHGPYHDQINHQNMESAFTDNS